MDRSVSVKRTNTTAAATRGGDPSGGLGRFTEHLFHRVSEQAGSAGRRKRVLEPGARGRAEDQEDCGVVLFSDHPDRSPLQPGEHDQTTATRDQLFVKPLFEFT